MKTPKQLKHSDIPKLRKWILNKKQNGECAVCGCVPLRPCLDHDHKKKIKGTGKIRGVLCNNCNVLIAKSENNCVRYGVSQSDLPRIFRAMADYLDKNQYPYIHPSEKPKAPLLTKASYNTLLKASLSSETPRKIPEYKVGKKGKRIQKLTKPLERLFEIYNITPEFYK